MSLPFDLETLIQLGALLPSNGTSFSTWGLQSMKSQHDEQNKTIQMRLCDFVCLVLSTSNKECQQKC